jgi:hypothetical protein
MPQRKRVPSAITQNMRAEKKEHPWMTQALLRKVAKDHVAHKGSGERVIVERTVMVPVPAKKKRAPVDTTPWFLRL